MTDRIPLLLLFLVGITHLSFAQTLQPTPPNADQQPHLSQDVHVVLEVRQVTLDDERITLLHEHGKLDFPEKWSSTVLDQQQTELLLELARGDRTEVPINLAIRLSDGEKREVPPLLERRPSQTYEATVSGDCQTIGVRLTWAKREDGREFLPATNATIPVGSHLLVHTQTLSEGRAPVSYWDRLTDRLFHRRPKPNPPRLQQGYLLVTPRIISQGAEEKVTVTQ